VGGDVTEPGSIELAIHRPFDELVNRHDGLSKPTMANNEGEAFLV
jgi:hypothetical protein